MQEFDWKNNVENKEEKIKLAKRMAKRVKNGDIIGFGSGSTSYLTTIEIANRVKEQKLEIKAIPTSKIIENLCNELNIETSTLEENKPDWCFDGADEIDSHNWLIKGMGAALYKEKLNMKSSNENYILVDNSKFVEKLGEKHPVPIEVKQDKVEEVKENLLKFDVAKIELRMSKNEDKPLVTDNGNFIIHAWFKKIEADLEERLLQIEGVVESGLFIGYDIIVMK